MKKTCKNCRFYQSNKEWVLPMNGEVVFKCHSKGCACYHWEDIPNPNAVQLQTRIVSDENSGHRIEYYYKKGNEETIIK